MQISGQTVTFSNPDRIPLAFLSVIPAQAGTQVPYPSSLRNIRIFSKSKAQGTWIPAFAGMTRYSLAGMTECNFAPVTKRIKQALKMEHNL